MAVSSLVRAPLYLLPRGIVDCEVTIRRRQQVALRRCAVPTIASDHTDSAAAWSVGKCPCGTRSGTETWCRSWSSSASEAVVSAVVDERVGIRVLVGRHRVAILLLGDRDGVVAGAVDGGTFVIADPRPATAH